ncbi:putative kelch-like protein 9 [Apostichopus japonicus]|uniref:Putative kelch-like protein 9 n=1 Tax=Stichopus japonicus TaxID=307972 RepID=A0A2G8JD43_STIJA|nr:putative kelch-like protein 9 [Apostichopus japonicus]
MRRSRSRSLPSPNEEKSRQGSSYQKTSRRRFVSSTPNPSRKPHPVDVTSVQSESVGRPYTTLPRIPKDSCMSTVVETSNSNLKFGSDDEAPHSERVLSAAAVLWRKKLLHDVILAVGHHRIGAHRLILAVCSGYFKDLFTNEENDDCEESSLVYTLHGLSYEALKILMESMYTSHLNVTYSNIYELLNAAIYLKVPVAVNKCKEFLLLNLCADTSLRTLTVSHAFELSEILEQAAQIAAMNFLHVAETDEFLEMEENPLKHLLKRDDLKVDSELKVFRKVQRWIESDMDNRLNKSSANVLSLVRLPMIKPTDLVDHVESVDYLMQIPEYETLVKEALHYYCLPLRQSVLQSPRTNPRSVVSLKTIVSLGGQPRKAKDGVSKEVRYFNPQTRNWNTLTKMPQPRHHHAVAVLGGFLYVAGGRERTSPTDHPLKTAYRYDPRTDSWIKIADMLHGRESFQLGILKEMIYAIGQGKISSRVECFAADVNTWKTRRPLQVPRIFGLLSPIGDHMYLAGGATVGNNGALCCAPHIEKYHPKSDTWITLSKMVTPRAEAGCTVLEKQIYYLGGYNWDTKSWVQTVEAYDTTTDSWEELGNFPKAFTGMACCTLTLTSSLDIHIYN